MEWIKSELITTIGFIIGLGLLQALLRLFMQKITDDQMRRNYLKEIRNKTKNIVE